MPTPLEILLDPISLGLIGLFVILIVLETLAPGRPLPKVKFWKLKCMLGFVLYFYLATYLPMLWDHYLKPIQLMDMSGMNTWLSLLIAVLVFEFFIYVWHRSLHRYHGLWLRFHQLHHSAERIDTLGAYFFSPLDMIGFTLVGSISLSVVAGLAPQTITYFLFVTTFLALFQHTNIKTPQWLGYIIQRPESHSVHHQRGVHAFNYSDLPLFDMLFGTFKNPADFQTHNGFYPGSSDHITDMLLFKDVSRPPQDL